MPVGPNYWRTFYRPCPVCGRQLGRNARNPKMTALHACKGGLRRVPTNAWSKPAPVRAA